MLRWPWVVAALLVAAPCAWIASFEWFSRDDFAFLLHVQRTDPWRWSEVFLPLEERFWPFYRPLAMEAFFWAGLRLFGLHASAWFGVALGVHFASGVLVHRIARQWGFAAPAALAAALLSVSRPPSLVEIYWASAFHYVASRLLGLAALALFQRSLRTGGGAALAGSWVALGLALLCNEVNAAIPVLLALGAVAADRDRRPGAAAARGLRRALPHAALVGAYLVFRFALLAPSELREVHTPALGPHALRNAWDDLVPVFGGAGRLAAAALACAGMALWRAGTRANVLPPGVNAEQRPLRTSAVCLAWLAFAVAPFALLPFPQLRYAMLLEVPASLLVGAWLDAAGRAAAARHPRAAELALAALVVVAIPYAELAARAAEPQGAPVRGLVRAVESLPGLREDSRVVVLYGAPGLADAPRALRLRYLAYNGAVLSAVHPERAMSLRFHDLAQRAPRAAARPGTLYLALREDLRLAPADPALLRRELARGMEYTP